MMRLGSNTGISDPKACHARLPFSIWWQDNQPPNLLQPERKIGSEDYGRKREHTARMSNE